MGKLTAIFATLSLTLIFCASACAGYVIDADLSDWSVTPFVDWQPQGNADYIVADSINLYDCIDYREEYDYEAMYFDDDAENFYFAVVGSYALGEDTKGGDLGIDLNGDFSVSSHGSVTGLEYAVKIRSDVVGIVLADPTWSRTWPHQWPDGWQGAPYDASDGTILGMATVAVKNYPLMEHGTYILELAVPRELFPIQYRSGDTISCHISHWCGNDSINLTGIINVPEPATWLLCCAGVILARRLRRKGAMYRP
jgi:hypothetical protein